MKFKARIGNQAVKIHLGSQCCSYIGSSLYDFKQLQITANPYYSWSFSPDSYDVAGYQEDGWSSVLIENESIHILGLASEIIVETESGTTYSTWGYIFSNEEDYNPPIPDPSNFAEKLCCTFTDRFNGPRCQLFTDDMLDHHFELAYVRSVENLESWNGNFYNWLSNTMGATGGKDLIDIGMFTDILMFNYVQDPPAFTPPDSSTANLYFGWYPADPTDESSTSFLVYLGYEMGDDTYYSVYDCTQDFFYYYPESVKLDLAYNNGY